MKKIGLIAGMASLASVAAVLWSLPAAATESAHDKWPGRDLSQVLNKSDDGDNDGDDSHGVPEPGTLALLALGLGGVGVYSLSRRKRVKA